MNTSALEKAKVEHSNNATHVLAFQASLPPVGYAAFTATQNTADESNVAAVAAPRSPPSSVSNGVYEVSIDPFKGISKITNIASGATVDIDLTWGYILPTCSIASSAYLLCELAQIHPGSSGTMSQAKVAMERRPDARTRLIRAIRNLDARNRHQEHTSFGRRTKRLSFQLIAITLRNRQ